jgi:hypothetical protein
MPGLVGAALRGFGKALGKIKSKKNLSLGDKLGMQDKGLINKKTGRLHPAHEDVFKRLKSKKIKKMTKTGRNPELGPGKGSPETKLEAKYIRGRRFK